MDGSIEGADGQLSDAEPAGTATHPHKPPTAQRSDATATINVAEECSYVLALLNASEYLPSVPADEASEEYNHSELAPVPPSSNSSPGSNPSSSDI
jgi:hypothetical protein